MVAILEHLCWLVLIALDRGVEHHSDACRVVRVHPVTASSPRNSKLVQHNIKNPPAWDSSSVGGGGVLNRQPYFSVAR